MALVADPQPPGVLFWRGSLEWLTRPCVAVVGTRRATPEGRSLAFELGRDLAGAGICVVSGLALGIDGSTHTGVLRAVGERGFAGPVGLAASGVDVPYPRHHRQLWEDVATHGAVISETLPDRPAEAWRFPLRNRLIAGLVRLVVVVESDIAGGSLHTVEAALARGVDVRAVPGPVRSRASAGTNQLLYDGAGVVRDAQDVLDALGLVRPPGPARVRFGGQAAAAELPGGRESTVLEAVGWTPTSLEQVVARSGCSVPGGRAALASLAAGGLVRQGSGWWVRVGRATPGGR
jgi:DNA processing protein